MSSAVSQEISPLPGDFASEAEKPDAMKSLMSRFQSIPLRDIALLFRFLSTLVEAGLPLTRCLNFARMQSRSELLKEVLGDILSSVQSGNHLSTAIAKFPRFFPELIVQMIVVGENSGELGEMFLKISQFLEKRLENRSNIKSAMTYPAFLFVACMGAIAFMLTSAVPKLANIFDGLGAELPAITQFFLDFGVFLSHWGLIILGALIAAVVGFRFFIATEHGRQVWDKVKLHIPFFGGLMDKSAAAQFASTLSILSSSGVDLLKSLEITGRTVDNAHLREQLVHIRQAVANGSSLHQAIADSKSFSDVVTAMVAVGEESGELDRMLTHVRDIYEQEVDLAIKTFTKLIEPIMIVSMTGIVGVIAASILIPLADISSAIK